MECALPPRYPDLTPEKALIFRITHRDNVPWILDHGLHCASSDLRDPNFISIGKPDLIKGRSRKRVKVPPGGTLADYVPFYFAPRTPMLGDIRLGCGGVAKRANDEIIFLVSSLHDLDSNSVTFLFTDRHAATRYAQFSSALADLPGWVPWEALRAMDFKRDPDNPDAFERYQAEALAYRHVPIGALQAIACYSESVKTRLDGWIAERVLAVKTVVRPGWYIP